MLRAEAIGHARPFVLAAVAALALAVVVRYEAAGFVELGKQARSARAANAEMGLAWGDVLIRDLPKARKIFDGHFFADAHYLGEAHWYPFLTPLGAATIARLSGWSVERAYRAMSVVLQGAALAALGVLFFVLLGRTGLAFVAVCLVLRKIEPPPACIYPVNAATFALLLHLTAAAWLMRATGERRFADAARPATLFGVTTGLLVLLHGASFFCGFVVCLVVLAWAALRVVRSDGVAVKQTLVALGARFAIPAAVAGALLFGPQLIRYGHIARPETARLWLNTGVYHDANQLRSLVRFVLFPARDALEAAVLALPLLFLSRSRAKWRRTLLPFAVAIAVATVEAHLGFVLRDAAHPRVASLARAFQLAPPHTFISVMINLVTLTRLLVIGALVASILGVAADKVRRRRAGAAPALDLGSLVAVGAAVAVLLVKPPATYWLGYEPWGNALMSFARRSAELTADHSVYMARDYSLVWLADVSPLFFPYEVETNPYVTDERRAANERLVAAARTGDDAAADAILDQYRVTALFVGSVGEDDVVRRCAGPPLLHGPRAATLYSRRKCGPR